MYKSMVIAIGIGLAIPGIAYARDKFHPDIAETDHASPATAKILKAFFAAKSKHDVSKTMSFFAPDMLTYTDSTVGWPLDGFGPLKGVFEKYMPQWPASGLSYPVRIVGGQKSAFIEFINTKELFGDELRVFAVVDLKDDKIVRWVDYWDGNAFNPDGYQQMRTPAEQFPTTYKERDVRDNASGRIRDVATKLQAALSTGNAKEAAALFSYEAIFEDRTLRSEIVGQAAIERYLSRSVASLPYGASSSLRHVVGGDLGGGFEWIAGSVFPQVKGVTSLELNAAGKITRATSVYDGRQIPSDGLKNLATVSLEQ